MANKSEEMIAAKLFEAIGGLTDSIPKMMERIVQLEGALKTGETDRNQVLEELDKLRTAQEKATEEIRRAASRRRDSISGLEDEAQKFSLVKTIWSIKAGGDEAAFARNNAGFEWEVLKQARAKGQNSDVGSTGGFFVPDQVIPDVIAAIYTRSVLIGLEAGGRTRVSVIDGLVGNNARIPKMEGGVVAYWIGEEDAYAEHIARTGDVTMSRRKLGCLVRLTDEMRRGGSFGFENLLRIDMERAMAKKLDWTILYGPGTDNAPRGVANMRNTKTITAEDYEVFADLDAARAHTWVGGDANFDLIDEMRGSLEDDDITIDDGGSFATIMAPRGERYMRQLKIDNFSGQTTGQPYLLGAPLIKPETLRAMIGDYDKTTQIGTTKVPGASIGGTTSETDQKYSDIFAGNWSEIVVGRWSGLEFEDDGGKGEGFVRDVMYMKTRMHVDVASRQDRAIVLCPDAKVRK